MNFIKLEYLPYILIAFGILATLTVIFERRFFKIVKTYWFFKRSLFSYLASIFFLLGVGGLLLSLLDARGPEERIKAETPVERTIILVDTSASMLAEDAKPSRLEKAALLAKHFARKAVGHQISIVAFAEITKKIVPFTNDLDLIDARLDSIKILKNQNATSALTVAIQESIQYFKETGKPQGNILVLTDGEETSEGINLNVPKEIHIALVGIGTTNGGRIPLDDSRGFRFGYKKYKGQDVITKLNESFFKSVVKDLPSAKYWLANSYTLPTEEILSFFKGEKTKSGNLQDMVIRPVRMEWIVVPSVIFLILSYLLKSIRVFTLLMIFTVLPVKAQDQVELTPEIENRMLEMQRGELNKLEKVKLADDLYKAGLKKEAIELYGENLKGSIDKDLPPEAYLNYGTALLENSQERKGLSVYENLLERLGNSESEKKVKEMIEKNVVSYFQQQEQKKQQEKKKKEEGQDQKDKKDQNQGEGQENKTQSGESGQQQKKNQSEGSESEQKKKDKGNKGEQKDQKDQEKDNNNQEEKNNSPQNQGEKKRMKKKIPAKLKQLMSDDRQLQMKMIEQGTRDMNKRKSRTSKDW